MKFILCCVLTAYSLGLAAYAVSQLAPAEAACTNCFSGEVAFKGGTGPNGEASTPQNRYVNVGFVVGGSSPNRFSGAEATKIGNAIDLAAGSWNTRTGESGEHMPYTVGRSANADKVNVFIGQISEIPGKKDACAGIMVEKDAQGNIKQAVLVIRSDVFARLTDQQVADILEHELGHFFGLADIDAGRTGQCESVMDKASSSCVVKHDISKGDVTTAVKFVNNNNGCNRKRGVELNILDTNPGGYIDPVPDPYYYPYPICYNFYEERTSETCVTIDGERSCRIDMVYYVLVDSFCFY